MTSTILNQSQSTLIGDSFVSLSNLSTLNNLSQGGSEDFLLELWLAQLGQEQIAMLADTVPKSNQVRISQVQYQNITVLPL